MTNAISANGLALIQEYEGFRASPAQLPDGTWVVGYSHVRVGEPGADLTQTEAAQLLTLDVAPVERLVNGRVSQPLNQSQFDALVSFAFSVGAEAFEKSQVLRRVNTADFVTAACAMDAWRKSDVTGELAVVDALVRRRAAEKALFLKDMPHDAAPSAFMRAKLDHAASILGAPVSYAAAPEVGTIPLVQPKPADAVRIAEILKSEPATEALLLTRVAPDEVAADEEIFTAHAKPMARQLDGVREATRRAYAEQSAAEARKGFAPFSRIRAEDPTADQRIRNMRKRAEFITPLSYSMDNVGLLALLLFGLGLIVVGGSMLFRDAVDFVDIAAASALAAPGLLATLMAAFGLWRGPQAKAVEA